MVKGLDRIAAPILVAIGAACGPAAEKPLDFRPVAAENVQRLEAAIGPDPVIEKADPELVDRARQLVGQVASQKGDVRLSFAEQSKQLGDAIVPVLSGWIGNQDWGWADRTAAIELLAGLDSPRAAVALEYHARNNPETRVRSFCAWHLGDTHQDQCTVGLLDAMHDERDVHVQSSIATALARFGCYAFWPPPDRADAASSREMSARWRFNELDNKSAGSDFVVAAPSDRLRLEVWRRIASLSGADPAARSRAVAVLGDLPAYAADLLGLALRDTSTDVRRGAARALARMELRGSAAGPTLHESLLRDPAVTLEAIEALGAVHEESAASDIVRYLEPDHPLEQRVAAARALGRLVDGRTLSALQSALKPGEPAQLRTAAAIGLVAFGREKEAFPVLDEALSSATDNVSDVEAAIQTWLQTRADRNDEHAREWLKQWVAPSATRATRTKLLHDEILPTLR